MVYEYRGFEIRCPDLSNHCTVENYHTGFSADFETFDAACEWIDEQLDDDEEVEEGDNGKVHTYLFFYVDDDTDRSERAYIKARNYDEAVDILYDEYSVYQVADYTMLD